MRLYFLQVFWFTNFRDNTCHWSRQDFWRNIYNFTNKTALYIPKFLCHADSRTESNNGKNTKDNRDNTNGCIGSIVRLKERNRFDAVLHTPHNALTRLSSWVLLRNETFLILFMQYFVHNVVKPIHNSRKKHKRNHEREGVCMESWFA